MKKTMIIMLVILLPILFLIGCEEEDDFGLDSFDFGDGQTAIQPTTTIAGNAENVVSSRYFEEAVDQNGKKYYKSIGYVKAGDSVRLKGGTPLDIKYDKANYRIAPAQLQDGRNVLISIWYLMPNQKKAVVTSDVTATVYDGLEPVDSTTFTIPRGTIIAVVSPEAGATRHQFIGYQIKQPVGNPVSFGLWGKFYIESADVSTNVSDLKMVEAIAKIKKKDKNLWNKDVEAVVNAYGDSVFVADALALVEGDSDAAGPRETEEASFSGIITANNVNVRSEPNEKLDNINEAFDKGVVVQILSQTKDEYTISGHKSRWYYVEGDGKSGWIFGYYLEKGE